MTLFLGLDIDSLHLSGQPPIAVTVKVEGGSVWGLGRNSVLGVGRPATHKLWDFVLFEPPFLTCEISWIRWSFRSLPLLHCILLLDVNIEPGMKDSSCGSVIRLSRWVG